MSPSTEVQLLEAFDRMSEKFDEQSKQQTELRIKVERLIADQESRETVCRITHEALSTRLKRHSDGFTAAREAQISQLEDELEDTKTGLLAPRSAPWQVDKWKAIGALAGTAAAALALGAALLKMLGG